MNNTYGIVRPSVIDPTKDVEIWYKYTPNRSNNEPSFMNFTKMDSADVSSILKCAKKDDNSIGDERDSILPGMFNLSLPAALFGNPGFYTVYIKPREIRATIKYVGVLAAYPDVRGIVIDVTELDSDNRVLFRSDNLSGYRVEYFEAGTSGSDLVRQDYYRLITSCGLCEPVSQNLTSANSNSTGYRYNESGTLSFLTLTPGVAPNFKGNQRPFIGMPSQQINIINTKFDPVMLEIEICRNDFDTLTTVLTGDQIRSLDNGLITTFNDKHEIFLQKEAFTVKDTYTNSERYDVIRRRINNIDMTVNYNEIIGDYE